MILTEECDLLKLTTESLFADFDCGDSDLNDFFNRDALLFQDERLGQTYYCCLKQTKKIVCAFSLSADSIKTALLLGSRIKKIKELIPREKALLTYPALLIGRLGVSVEFSGKSIGSQMLDNIKQYCDVHFPHLVRFLVVDAYNKDTIISFYKKNNFSLVFSSEQQEKENIKKKIAESDPLHTRQMFYDMKRWKK